MTNSTSLAKKVAKRSVAATVLISATYYFGPTLYNKYVDLNDKKKKKNEEKKFILVLPFHRMNIVEQKKVQLFGPRANNPDARFDVELNELTNIIHHAAQDPNIVGLHGDFGISGSISYIQGMAQLCELRNAIRVFNESHRRHYEPDINNNKKKKDKSNKPEPKLSTCFAGSFISSGINPAYFLASQFSQVHLHDKGILNLFGLSMSSPFLKGALEKYGIKVHVFRHGEFKNMANIFTESGYDKYHFMNSKAILTSLQGIIDDAILCSRKKFQEFSSGHPDSWSDIREYGTLTMENAKEIGLIDSSLTSPSQILPPDGTSKIDYLTYSNKIKSNEANEKRYNDWVNIMNDLKRFLQSSNNTDEKMIPSGRKDKIAVVYVTGNITDDMSYKVINKIKKAKKEDSVKCVILRIDSPGGSAIASEAIHAELKDLNKPLICSMGNTAASGGYYVAAAAEKIFASPATITGSIGVVGMKLDLSELASQYGITFDSIPVGPHSNTENAFSPLTAKMKENHVRQMALVYDGFKGIVADGRNMTLDEVEKLAKGRVYTGKEALELGLVDELGGLNRAVLHAQKKVNKDAEVVIVRDQPSLTELLSSVLSRANLLSTTSDLTASEDTSANYDGRLSPQKLDTFLGAIFSKSVSSLSRSKSLQQNGIHLCMNEDDAISHMLQEIFQDD